MSWWETIAGLGSGGDDYSSSAMGLFRGLDRSIPNLSEGWYQGLLNNNNRDYSQAFGQANKMRWTGGMGSDIPLRNAEHGLFAQDMWRSNGPWGKLSPAVIPLYTGVKAGVQKMPALSRPMNALFGEEFDLTQATPASWEELWWGLRPLWGDD